MRTVHKTDFAEKSSSKTKVFYAFSILLAFITGVRLLLFAHAPYAVTPQYPHDHGLLFHYAVSMSEGKWLGIYSNLTLAKGIGFSLFLCLANYLKVPYGVLLGIYVIVCCALFTYSLKPWISNIFLRGFIYLFMLFCPVACSYIFGTGVYRNTLVPWSVLGYISGVLGIYTRIGKKGYGKGSVCGWCAVSAFFFTHFWLLREDSVWILPFALVSSGAIIVRRIRKRSRRPLLNWLTIISAIMPFILCLCSVMLISSKNNRQYGLFTMNDRTGTFFSDVLSDLHHIDDGKEHRDVWISRKQLEIAIRESDTLASMQDPIWALWNNWSGGEDNELLGDIGQWALRDGVAAAGQYQDAAQTNQIFRQIHEQIQDAFANKRISTRKGLYLSSQARAFYLEDFVQSLLISFRVWHNVSIYRHCDMREEIVQSGDMNEVFLWENYLGMYGVKTDEQLSAMDASSSSYADWNDKEKAVKQHIVFISNQVLKIYKALACAWIPLTWICYIALTLMVVINRKKAASSKESFPVWLFVTGILLCEFVHIYISTLFSRWLDAEKLGNVYDYYNYAPASYILIQIAEAICIIYVVIHTVKQIRVRRGRRYRSHSEF